MLNPNYNEALKQYKRLLKARDAFYNVNNSSTAITAKATSKANQLYYDQEEAFKTALKKLLNEGNNLRPSTDIEGLTKKQLFNVIKWCSSHRPYPLHTMFNILSQPSQYD